MYASSAGVSGAAARSIFLLLFRHHTMAVPAKAAATAAAIHQDARPERLRQRQRIGRPVQRVERRRLVGRDSRYLDDDRLALQACVPCPYRSGRLSVK